MYLGTYDIDEYVAIPATTHRFSSGAAYDPTSLTYSIYEEGSATGIDENVDMIPSPAGGFDGITGCYYSRRQLTAAAGFERNKTYIVVVKATVDGVAAIETHVFQVRAILALDTVQGDHGLVSIQDDVDAIKAKTDSLTFTVAGDVDANVQSWKGAAAADIASETDIAAAVNDHISAAVSTPSPDTNSATSFETTLPSSVDDFYNDMLLTITSGALIKQVKKVTNYDGTSKVITVGTGFTGTPADGVTFDLVHQ